MPTAKSQKNGILKKIVFGEFSKITLENINFQDGELLQS